MKKWVSLFALMLLLPLPVAADKGNLVKPAQSAIVPDKFLRSWDTVTLFFSGAIGPAKGGAEDHPEKFVLLKPPHPGAYTWLDGGTLQFRPAEPWPPLKRFDWNILHGWSGRSSYALETLMAAPQESMPRDGEQGLDPVSQILFYFAEPVDVQALNDAITLELRHLPGVNKNDARWLDKKDFTIKALQRGDRSDRAGYMLSLHQPIGNGNWAAVHFRLALSDRTEQSFYHVYFSTKAPLRVTHAGCADKHFPITDTGVHYAPDQALSCESGQRRVEVLFSAPLQEVGPLAARNLLHFTPAVDDLAFTTEGSKLVASGQFKAETIYQLHLQRSDIADSQGNPLQMTESSQLYFYFPKQSPFLDWQVSQGVVERYGPQMLPVRGRGFDRVDIRLYPIDALDRNFWPIGDQVVVVEETQRPPSPGEEPAKFSDLGYISPDVLMQQIRALGSPSVSKIVQLPLVVDGTEARFGLNMSPLLQSINRQDSAGAYLLGMRKLNGENTRAWVRLQVTDLSLTAVHELSAMQFFVTSLHSGKAVAGAEISVEGSKRNTNQWTSLVQGKTDAQGRFQWAMTTEDSYNTVLRAVVKKDSDILVVEPAKLDEYYQDNLWRSGSEAWFSDARLYQASPERELRCHVFTERPVYRPDQKVHIKAYVRNISAGQMEVVKGDAVVIVTGPGELQWRYKTDLTPAGSLYHAFEEPELPTGDYSVQLEVQNKSCGSASFKKEAYRLPTFEVRLHGEKQVRLDEPFQVKLTADYYAGGKVSQRPIRWRVTQFPLTWSPKKVEGFFYSTDGRYSGEGQFRAQPAIAKTGETDAFGASSIDIDPTAEPTAQPRRYVIEATVTGADDQTVTDTTGVDALPPFALAVKLPRFLEKAESVSPEMFVVDAKGDYLQGQKVTVRLLQRQWHSHLQAGDFSQGVAKYVTEVVDNKLQEVSFISGKAVHQERFAIREAGVYIVEVEASDQLGRTQRLVVDLFAGGAKAVTWSKPPSQVFQATADKDAYAPGEQAVIVLESPFQNAQALAIVEEPEGRNRYEWLAVHNGAASFKLDIKKHYLPRLPVHFILMRGRGDAKPSGNLDLSKPTTIAATTWLTVKPLQHQVAIELAYPAKAQPGDEVELTLHAKDQAGKPLAGEATLWLVDQAVLALGKEQPLDPLPDMIVDRGTHVAVRDTRRQVIGYIPFMENPGGDGGMLAEEAAELLDNVTIRRNFDPVPYYNPRIDIPATGTVKLKIKLPDNLTNFKIRAKAIHGADRFGFATGQLSVRLPVIVQPGLPRFVRPGDMFKAVAIGRIVEGEGGEGRASLRAKGLKVLEDAAKTFVWNKDKPQRIEYGLQVPDPGYDEQGRLTPDTVAVTVGVERTADKARDAFEIQLPIKPDRQAEVKRRFVNLNKQQPFTVPAITAETRPGTLKRRLLFSTQPGVLKMAAGLNYLLDYPYGCTEQRISLARGFIAAGAFREALYQDADEKLKRVVEQTLEWLGQVKTDNNLIAFWPASTGYVSLTAWSVQFMLEAQQAGFAVDDTLLDQLLSSLKQSLRSDYSYFIDGGAYSERVFALNALAQADRLDSSYAAELARKTEYLDVEDIAMVTRALARAVQEDKAKAVIEELNKKIWQGLIIRQYQGHDRYGGLQSTEFGSPLLLSSEVRALAEVVHTFSQTEDVDKAKVRMLVDGLVALGKDDGWGSTQENAAALLALSQVLKVESAAPVKIQWQSGTQSDELQWTTALSQRIKRDAAEIKLNADTDVLLSVEDRYLPREDGSLVKAQAQGFVVQRGLSLWKEKEGRYEKTENIKLDHPGQVLTFHVGDIAEDHVEVVNAADRTFVAVVIPLAAGMEPLNPSLATAPPEAKTEGELTMPATYVMFADDQVAYFYNQLPKGNYHFYFRTKATVPGEFIQPAAYAERMYEQSERGGGTGAKVVVKAVAEK